MDDTTQGLVFDVPELPEEILASASVLQRSTWAYHRAQAIAATGIPYSYGGGHGIAPTKTGFPPTKGVDPTGRNPRGLDCSSAVSTCIWYGGMLDKQEAMSTHELELWGRQGHGPYMTVYVINNPEIEHTVLGFTLPGHPPRIFAAMHTGTIVGFWDGFPTAGYTPRHWQG